MSRIPLKVTRRRKSLKKVLGTAHSHEFLTMIWAANALVQQRTGAGLKYLQVPPGIVNEIVLFSVTVDGYSDIDQRHRKISDIAQRH